MCGEFVSPEIIPVLETLGLYNKFTELSPHRVTRMSITLGSRTKTAPLPEPAYGLSRYAFDHLLWSGAISRGAVTAAGGKPNICDCCGSASIQY